jgi:hypothetical protein
MIVSVTFVVLVFLCSLVSSGLERTLLTVPMVFTAAGSCSSFSRYCLGPWRFVVPRVPSF